MFYFLLGNVIQAHPYTIISEKVNTTQQNTVNLVVVFSYILFFQTYKF